MKFYIFYCVVMNYCSIIMNMKKYLEIGSDMMKNKITEFLIVLFCAKDRAESQMTRSSSYRYLKIFKNRAESSQLGT